MYFFNFSSKPDRNLQKAAISTNHVSGIIANHIVGIIANHIAAP